MNHDCYCYDSDDDHGPFKKDIDTPTQGPVVESRVRESPRTLGKEEFIVHKPPAHNLSPGLLEELGGLSVDRLPGEPGYKGPGFPVETTQWPEEALNYAKNTIRFTTQLHRNSKPWKLIALFVTHTLVFWAGVWLGRS